ncbi:MAG: hypothetical protein JW864_05945 [Spirochaetes bacterium]|nr:hypothetical protein [Spirochaetota bacterium]
MKKKIFTSISLTLFLCAGMPLSAEKLTFSAGINASFMPSMGGSLATHSQESYYQSSSGVDGINRRMDGYKTSDIERLTGACFGFDFNILFYDYFLLRTGFNYGRNVCGGKGKTVFYSPAPDDDYFILECEYSYRQYDIPLTAGVCIPFWNDAKISVSCGAAYANALYKNKFESEDTAVPFERKGKFSGWGIPLVVMIQGDYFVNEKIALTTKISYYRGRSRLKKDKSDDDGDTDFATLDFTGYKFNLGVSYYIFLK